MTAPLLVILMGSGSDKEHSGQIAEAARGFGLDVEMRVGSAHRTPEHVLELLRQYEADPRPKVYITVAGRSDALSGLADNAVSAPVIACPPPSDSFAGVDVFSSLRMPSGIAPAVVLEPSNAALSAAKILGLSDPSVRAEVARFQRRKELETMESDQAMKGGD